MKKPQSLVKRVKSGFFAQKYFFRVMKTVSDFLTTKILKYLSMPVLIFNFRQKSERISRKMQKLFFWGNLGQKANFCSKWTKRDKISEKIMNGFWRKGNYKWTNERTEES